MLTIRKKLFDHYEIDSNGYIFNLKTKRKMSVNYYKQKDFYRLNLVVNKKKKKFYLHTLIAKAFHPGYDHKTHSITFINGNKKDCSIKNLLIEVK